MKNNHLLKLLKSFSFRTFICLLPALAGACAQPKKADNAEATASAKETKAFTLPAIPEMLNTPSLRADYLVKHYWDNFDFKDTASIHAPEVVEQYFVDYITTFPYSSYSQVATALHSFLARTEKESDRRLHNQFIALFEKYLFDPNSPYRNDEYYIPVAEYISTSGQTAESDRLRASFRLQLLKKNRPGETASDFVYTRSDGKTGRMHHTKSDYTLLLFYNPDCHTCEEIIKTLTHATSINYLIDKGSLRILAIYPDEDIPAWERHLSHIPPAWINGYDRDSKIKNNALYDLKAIPSLYLLDRDKRVLLKDAEVDIIVNYLRNTFAI